VLVYDTYFKRLVEQVDEIDAISDLRRSSKEFKKFYDKERVERLGDISWRLDPDFEVELRMRSHTRLIGGLKYHIIYMEKTPLLLIDACVTAHEIMHLIRNEECASLVILSKNKYPDAKLAMVLQSMFEDPIIDSILQNEYEFDVIAEYRTDLESDRVNLEMNHKEPDDEIEKLILAFQLSYFTLKWNMIVDKDALRDWSTFQGEIGKRYPNISEMSENIVSIVQKTGVETTEKTKIASQEIIISCGLERILSVGYHPYQIT
jgi:hypothetical protein